MVRKSSYGSGTTLATDSIDSIVLANDVTVDVIFAIVDNVVSLVIVIFARKLATSNAGQESMGAGGSLVFFTEPLVVICPIASMKVTMADKIVPQNAP